MKKNALTTAFLFFSIVLITGCGGLPTRWEQTVKIDDFGDVPNGIARIIFFSPTGSGAKVFDATNDDLILLGNPGAGQGIVRDIEPGDYLFMVYGENADFMLATLEPNRTYYALIQWRFGIALTRFGLWPIRNGAQGDYPFESELVQRWIKNIDYVAPHEKYLSFWGSERLMRSYQKQRYKYWAKWEDKLPEEKLRRTLLPEDGIPTRNYSSLDTQSPLAVRTEPKTVNPSSIEQKEIRDSAVENTEPERMVEAKPEPINSVSPSSQKPQPSIQKAQSSSQMPQPSIHKAQPSIQNAQGTPVAGKSNYIVSPRPSWLREVDARHKEGCQLVTSISRNVGGTAGVSKNIKNAINSAKTEAVRNGANSYFIANMESTDFGASVTLEALKCK